MTLREEEVIGKPKLLELDAMALLIKELAADGETLSLVGVAAPVRIVDPRTQVEIVMASVLVEFYPSAFSNAAMKTST